MENQGIMKKGRKPLLFKVGRQGGKRREGKEAERQEAERREGKRQEGKRQEAERQEARGKEARGKEAERVTDYGQARILFIKNDFLWQ
jgi:hypothetical protein